MNIPIAPDWSELLDLPLDRASVVPVFRQIYLGLRRLILAGAIPAGARLPPSRRLAERLAVSRTSVVGVYEQLLAEGYVTGRVGAGTFVAAGLREPPEPAPTSAPPRPHPLPAPALRLAALMPDLAQFGPAPFNTGRCGMDARSLAEWRGLIARHMRRADPDLLGYTDPRGNPRLREAVARYLRTSRAVHCEPEQILILSGTQQGMDLLVKVLLEPGDAVWVEDPCYPALLGAMRAARARVVPVPVDAAGMQVARGIAAAPRARVAYVTPSHQAPLGVVLSMARRLELLAWAREEGAWIIEDDYDSEFRYAGRPLASLQGIDGEEGRVIYLGSFSKVLFPGLRLGYAVVPRPLVPAFTAARYLADRQPPGLMEAVVADFLEEGHFSAHLRRMRAEYRTARDLLAEALRERLGGRLDITLPDQGMQMLARLPAGESDMALSQRGAQAGLMLRPASAYFLEAEPLNALMLGFTGHAPEALRNGVEALRALMG
ncbi:MocR-like pyridoxine biosynthesis transcription factor PdxR [Rhodovarius lipocyclicus]|uniref:MocR-like pyridoxine biosynthesis transcription factor PdxR n=1 Tax=Rhodovarius lipocyclicus TaxID=268410 RepID=UPI001F21C947|nr:PLP-dependent aminotransferase family protein [Rhodovarius lipocyclicus]